MDKDVEAGLKGAKVSHRSHVGYLSQADGSQAHPKSSRTESFIAPGPTIC